MISIDPPPTCRSSTLATLSLAISGSIAAAISGSIAAVIGSIRTRSKASKTDVLTSAEWGSSTTSTFFMLKPVVPQRIATVRIASDKAETLTFFS